MSENIGLAELYPIKLNNEVYPYLKTMDTGLNDYVTTHETEGGKQEDVTVRRGRKSIAISGVVLQPLLTRLLALEYLDEFTAEIYDPAIDDYATMLVRIGPGSMSYGLKEKSAKLRTTNGVWNVSFTLEEF
jgi:hypothetical protein